MADIHDLFKKFNNEISLSTDKQNNYWLKDSLNSYKRILCIPRECPHWCILSV